MKRLFLVLLVTLIASVWIANKALQDTGYILLSYNNTVLETSLWGGLILLFLAFVLFYITLRLLGRLLGGRQSVRRWSQRYKHRRSAAKTRQGTVDLLEGKWSHAQKKLAQAAPESDTPLLGYLAAARAAAENEDDQASEELLRRAQESTTGAELAVALARAEIQIQRGYYEQALAALLELRRNNQRHRQVHKLLQTVYLKLEDWQALIELVPALRKLKVSPAVELDGIEQKIVLTLINNTAKEIKDKLSPAARAAKVREVWQKTTARVRCNEQLVLAYVDCVAALGKARWAEPALREAIQSQWSERLVERYGLVEGEDVSHQLLTAENWLKERTNSAILMLTLGRLSMRNQLWGKAREYFIGSVKLSKSPQAYAELARLLEHLGDDSSSREYMRSGFSILSESLPNLPLPDRRQARLIEAG